MRTKIAVPVNNEGILDGHFGHCKFFALHTIEADNIAREEKIPAPPHEPGLLPRWLSELGVTDIIAGGMGHKAIELFNQVGVNVFVGAPSLHANVLVISHLKGTLQLTANYCDH